MPPVRVIALLLALLWVPAALAAVPRVLVVLSKPDTPYASVAQTVRAGLTESARAQPPVVAVADIGDFNALDTHADPPALIVTVGVDAARRIARVNPPAPILHTLVPRITALDILRNGRGDKPKRMRDSAIFLDQPIGRQLDLIRLALPGHRRIAVILGPTTQHLAPELRAAARERALMLNIASLARRDDLLQVLQDLMEENDALLSVPDPLVYRGETLHHVLLTTYRYKVPVVGLSRAYVDAGAVLAVYSTPEQIGQQAAQIAARLTAGNSASLPAPSYPQEFMVSINRRVAASLDLALEDEDALLRKLEALARP